MRRYSIVYYTRVNWHFYMSRSPLCRELRTLADRRQHAGVVTQAQHVQPLWRDKGRPDALAAQPTYFFLIFLVEST